MSRRQKCLDRQDSTDSDPDFMNTIITDDEALVFEYVPETKSFLHFPQQKSDDNSKHYLTQMLLAIT